MQYFYYGEKAMALQRPRNRFHEHGPDKERVFLSFGVFPTYLHDSIGMIPFKIRKVVVARSGFHAMHSLRGIRLRKPGVWKKINVTLWIDY